MKDKNIKMTHDEYREFKLHYIGEKDEFYKVKSILAKQHTKQPD